MSPTVQCIVPPPPRGGSRSPTVNGYEVETQSPTDTPHWVEGVGVCVGESDSTPGVLDGARVVDGSHPGVVSADV